MSKKVIESILKTYIIPKKLKEKITYLTFQKIHDNLINNYDEIYEYIDEIINKFQTPYQERFFIRLDISKYENSATLHHEFISTEEIEETSRKQTSFQNTLSILDTYEILEKHLDKTSFSLFKQLLFEENMQLNVSKEFLIKNPQKIKKRLEQLVKKDKNRFFIPRRPIIQINPIKFRRRNYNKNPLAFFNLHIDYYRNLSRSELFKLDAGLYTSLIRWNQIESAIPEIITPGSSTKLKQDKINAIIKSYKKYGIVQKVAKEHCISRFVVDKYLIKEDLKKPRNKKGTYGYPKEKIDKIIKAYEECKIASQVAKKFNVNRFTVIKHWREAGFKIISKGNSKERVEYYA